MLTVALETGRHVVIEGPPGAGNSTLLRDIARHGFATSVLGRLPEPVLLVQAE